MGVIASVLKLLERNRLRQHYELALRHWGHVILAPDVNLVGVPARQVAEIKQKAYDERNAAKERMVLREQNCLICNRRRKPSDVQVSWRD
jgi:hypothetical protein